MALRWAAEVDSIRAMEQPLNPYAPPVATGPGHQPHAPGAGTQYWFEGEELVAHIGASLPDICIFSGEPAAEGRITKTLQWYPPWIGALVIVSWPIALILMMVMRKRGDLSYCIGAEAKKRRTTGILIATVGSIVLMGVGIAGLAAESAALGIIGMLGFVVALIAGIVMAQLFQVKKIDDGMIRIKVKPAFIDAMARLQGGR